MTDSSGDALRGKFSLDQRRLFGFLANRLYTVSIKFLGDSGQGVQQVIAFRCDIDNVAAFRDQYAGLVRISKERDRYGGAEQDQVLYRFKLLQGNVYRILNALDRHPINTTFPAPVAGFAGQTAPRLCHDSPGHLQRLAHQRGVGDMDHALLAGGQCRHSRMDQFV